MKNILVVVLLLVVVGLWGDDEYFTISDSLSLGDYYFNTIHVLNYEIKLEPLEQDVKTSHEQHHHL